MAPSTPRPELTRRQRRQVADLFRQEAHDLHRYACSLPWARACDAPDLVQKAFEAVCRAWDDVGPLSPGQRRKWLRQAVRYRSIDLCRRPAVSPLTDDLPHPHSPCDDVGDRVAFALALEACWRVIESMPPTRRTVACLLWRESWTTQQVAEHLGLAPSTVRGHLREARGQIKAGVGHLVSFTDDEEEEEEPSP
uniref:RNA polymerase sigma factor n=1 Tax=Herbidospora sakaeratensis TaxID=564415 RepID=UPI00078601E7|nr:sigma-70 family RNA polymerase sigma factor [Herbidospora sakaeratensis]